LNVNQEKEISDKKQNTLKFNQGFPIREGNVDRYFNIDGNLYCEKVFDESNLIRKIVKYDYYGNILEYQFFENEIIIEKIVYFSKSDTIRTHIIFNGKNYEVKEYYTNATIRSVGEKNINFKPIGIWKFYHHNGNVESVHEFEDGVLINKSTLFFEDGTLNIEIHHEPKN
jgi:antitoxin component YwqK of YwqJK toxin-antitoxin module